MSKDVVQNQSFPVTPTKGGSWALLWKSAVESTTLAQLFCVNQAVRDLPRHFHFTGEYSKLHTVKTMGTREKINAIWWNTKINLQKLVHTSGYELPTNLQNFTQKDLTEVNIFQKVFFGGEGYFFETSCTCIYNARTFLDDTESEAPMTTITIKVHKSRYFNYYLEIYSMKITWRHYCVKLVWNVSVKSNIEFLPNPRQDVGGCSIQFYKTTTILSVI